MKRVGDAASLVQPDGEFKGFADCAPGGKIRARRRVKYQWSSVRRREPLCRRGTRKP
jgi:hypothetical protein